MWSHTQNTQCSNTSEIDSMFSFAMFLVHQLQSITVNSSLSFTGCFRRSLIPRVYAMLCKRLVIKPPNLRMISAQGLWTGIAMTLEITTCSLFVYTYSQHNCVFLATFKNKLNGIFKSYRPLWSSWKVSNSASLDYPSLRMCLLCSNKGTFYVLCAPGVVHADPEVAEKYSTWTSDFAQSDCSDVKFCYTAVQKLFHEAGFDAFCAGFSEFMNKIGLIPRSISCFLMLHKKKKKNIETWEWAWGRG